MNESLFVGRQRELKFLGNLLKKTLTKKCQVCLIAGVAGDGKTTLAEHFAESASESNHDIVAVVGRCNAQTGPNDTYLPFREIMGQFTGIQAKLLYSAINKKASTWPSSLGHGAANALIEYGPDLIGTFVPGSALITRATLSAADQAIKKQLESRTDTQDVKKERIKAQYASVIQELAKKFVLILILDDLQWADEASLDLLTHLYKNAKNSRVLIIGTYRSEDVALGRDGATHPIEKILYDIKTEFGNVILDLTKSREEDGHIFVKELLKATKCAVSDTFKTEFFNRTRGLPLFSVELLRDLQERQTLIQDDAGNWTEKTDLDWNKLPAQLAKLDGLIDSRLTRLNSELREILNIASVEGQDFTAQIITTLLNLQEKQLLRTLSHVLGRQHNLISEIREIKVGGNVLSKYRFMNSTFQQYIYDDMSLGERRLWHTQIAETLETLYKNHENEVAVQLARHYEYAYKPEKVVHYLNLVAEQFSAVSEYQEAQTNLEKALSIAKTENDRKGMVDSLRILGGVILIKKGLYDESQEKLQEALSVANQIEYTKGQIHILRQLGIVARRKGQLTTSTKYYLDSLYLAQKENDKSSIARALNNLSVVAMDDKAFAEAQKYLETCLKIADEINDIRRKASALINFGDLSIRMMDYFRARSYLNEALTICEQLSSKSQIAEIKCLLGRVATHDNNIIEARQFLSESLLLSVDIGETPKFLDSLDAIAQFFLDFGFPELAIEISQSVLAHNNKSKINAERVNEVVEKAKTFRLNQSLDEIIESTKSKSNKDIVETAINGMNNVNLKTANPRTGR